MKNAAPLQPSNDWTGPNRLDFLRFFFASLVVFSHCWPLTTLDASNLFEPLSRLTSRQLSFGEIAVDAFFAISGFLVTKSWLKSRSVKDYLAKRITRIYPAFIVVILLQQFVVTPLLAHGPVSPFKPSQIGLTLYRCVNLASYPYKGTQPVVLTSNPLPYDMNGALWTIRYEFCCYILVLLLGIIGLYRRPRWILFLFVATIAWWASGRLPPWHRAGTAVVGNIPSWPRFLCFYLSGMLFFLFSGEIPKKSWLAALAAAVIIVSRFVPRGIDVTLPIAGTYLLFWIAFSGSRLLTGFGRRGDFSYGVYLYGFLIQQLLVYNFPSLLQPIKLFAVAWPISVLAGFLSWHGVEKHFLRRKRLKHLEPQLA